MVKFGKNKLKALNKIAKKHKTDTGTITNKVLKKKINAEKKVSFQKEVLFKEVAASGSPLVKNVPVKKVLLDSIAKKPSQEKSKKWSTQEDTPRPKLKPVEKQKKRQKTQVNDTKMLLKLMNKK